MIRNQHVTQSAYETYIQKLQDDPQFFETAYQEFLSILHDKQVAPGQRLIQCEQSIGNNLTHCHDTVRCIDAE